MAPALFAWTALASAAPAPAPPKGSPTQTLDAFHDALKHGDAARALEQLSRACTIYEQGFAENSKEEWAAHQLKDAMAFAGKTDYRTLRRESHADGTAAWVLSTTLTSGSFDGNKLELEGAETAILQQEAGEWRIVHLHWSAHGKAAEEAPPAQAPAADAPAAPNAHR